MSIDTPAQLRCYRVYLSAPTLRKDRNIRREITIFAADIEKAKLAARSAANLRYGVLDWKVYAVAAGG